MKDDVEIASVQSRKCIKGNTSPVAESFSRGQIAHPNVFIKKKQVAILRMTLIAGKEELQLLWSAMERV